MLPSFDIYPSPKAHVNLGVNYTLYTTLYSKVWDGQKKNGATLPQSLPCDSNNRLFAFAEQQKEKNDDDDQNNGEPKLAYDGLDEHIDQKAEHHPGTHQQHYHRDKPHHTIGYSRHYILLYVL